MSTIGLSKTFLKDHMVSTCNMMINERLPHEKIQENHINHAILVLKLKKEFKKLKRKNIEEMNALRAKNARMKHKLKKSSTMPPKNLLEVDILIVFNSQSIEPFNINKSVFLIVIIANPHVCL